MNEENILFEEIVNNRKNITIKIFLDENENLFIRNKLDQLNNNLKNKKIKNKSLSEFLREIVLTNLLNISSLHSNNENEVLQKIEKISKRNLSLIFELIKKEFGEDKAKEILNNIKEKEKMED